MGLKTRTLEPHKGAAPNPANWMLHLELQSMVLPGWGAAPFTSLVKGAGFLADGQSSHTDSEASTYESQSFFL